MLLIIEILFLVAGLWAIITGKIPMGFLRFLFGKGDYFLPSKRTRLLGLFFLSPLPLSFLVSIILVGLFGAKGTGFAIVFEIIYVLVVITVSIVILRKAKQPEIAQINKSVSLPSETEKKTTSYGNRLLIIFGVMAIGFITVCSFGTLTFLIINSIRFGLSPKDDFWSVFFTVLLLVALIGGGLFGIIKLAKILRK